MIYSPKKRQKAVIILSATTNAQYVKTKKNNTYCVLDTSQNLMLQICHNLLKEIFIKAFPFLSHRCMRRPRRSFQGFLSTKGFQLKIGVFRFDQSSASIKAWSGERWWSGNVSASQSKDRMFESVFFFLDEGESTLPSQENNHKNLHVDLKTGHNSGSPGKAEDLVCWSFPLWINRQILLTVVSLDIAFWYVF